MCKINCCCHNYLLKLSPKKKGQLSIVMLAKIKIRNSKSISKLVSKLKKINFTILKPNWFRNSKFEINFETNFETPEEFWQASLIK